MNRRMTGLMAAFVFAMLVGGSLAQDNSKDNAKVKPKDDPTKKDLEKVQGVWQLVVLEVNGKSQEDDFIQKTKVTFKGEMTSHPDRDGNTVEATFKFDASKKPTTIDFTPSAGGDAGKVHAGLYKLDGDTLILSLSKPGDDRPTELKKDGSYIYAELKRDKK